MKLRQGRDRLTLVQRRQFSTAAVLVDGWRRLTRLRFVTATPDRVARLHAEAAVFEVVDARTAMATDAMSAYFAELDVLFVGGFDPGDTLTADAASFDPPSGAFVVVRAAGEPAAI